ncbi:MAG: FAD-binding protein [Nocardioidaceae bacterium]
MADRRRLTGWGRTAPSAASVREVAADQVAGAVRSAPERGVIVRGLGRSYGDAAQNAGGLVLELPRDTTGIHLDPDAGTATVAAGVSLDDVMRALIPRGWFVPVTPGTRYVSVGGALATDIHGKNHHRVGSFGAHVRSVDLVDGRGQLRVLSAETSPREFWATVGGMGLTGAITSTTFSVLPVETASMRVDTDRVSDLDSLLDLMATTDDRYTYSVAWIDLLATGRTLGRSVLTRGEHARLDELPAAARSAPLDFGPKVRVGAPPIVPRGLMNPLTVRAFNEMWFRKAPRRRRDEIQPLAGFFHPLDGVAGWNRMYGSTGFVQYQFVVPDGAESVMRTAVARIAEAGHASFLAVLKRFGPGNPGVLSFPMAGWTLALDLPASNRLVPLLDGLDELVLDAGGRTYLAKDSRSTAATIAAMYPRLDELRDVRRALDPDGVFVSDLARRLDLTGES